MMPNKNSFYHILFHSELFVITYFLLFSFLNGQNAYFVKSKCFETGSNQITYNQTVINPLHAQQSEAPFFLFEVAEDEETDEENNQELPQQTWYQSNAGCRHAIMLAGVKSNNPPSLAECIGKQVPLYLLFRAWKTDIL